MASRKEQKDAARQRRLAEEQAAQAKSQRTRRLQILGGVGVVAVIVVAVLIVASIHSGKSTAAVDVTAPNTHTKSVAAQVNDSIKGIPQSGNVLGNPKAKVTLTEFGDLECPVCKDFATGPEAQLIAHQVKQGTVKIVYRSYPTASRGAKNWQQIFPMQQDAAYAAGLQNKAWNYILLFYHEQGTEDSNYVDAAYLTGLAKQVPSLQLSKWATDRFNPKYTDEVDADEAAATKLDIGGTPGLMFSGPKSQTKLYSGLLTYPDMQTLIKEVS